MTPRGQASWKPPPPRRVRAIRDRLRRIYGVPLAKPHGYPIAELILTVLSQSTNDRNRDVAYLALRERFTSWENVRDAPVDEIEDAIRPGGISRVKSARIKSILQATTETAPEHGASPDEPLSLDWLASQPVAKGRQYLCSLPGVGRKTAACVLLFALGFKGQYVIFDLPHFSALQSFYLDAVGLPAGTAGHRARRDSRGVHRVAGGPARVLLGGAAACHQARRPGAHLDAAAWWRCDGRDSPAARPGRRPSPSELSRPLPGARSTRTERSLQAMPAVSRVAARRRPRS